MTYLVSIIINGKKVKIKASCKQQAIERARFWFNLPEYYSLTAELIEDD